MNKSFKHKLRKNKNEAQTKSFRTFRQTELWRRFSVFINMDGEKKGNTKLNKKKDFLAPKMDSVTYSFLCGNEHFENLISFLGHDELLK